MLVRSIIALGNFGEELVPVVLQIPNPKNINVIGISSNSLGATLNRLQICNEVLLQTNIVWVDLTQKLRACDFVLLFRGIQATSLSVELKLVAGIGVEPIPQGL